MLYMTVGKENSRDIEIYSCRPEEHSCDHRQPLHAVLHYTHQPLQADYGGILERFKTIGA
jgi:hypothetical protein